MPSSKATSSIFCSFNSFTGFHTQSRMLGSSRRPHTFNSFTGFHANEAIRALEALVNFQFLHRIPRTEPLESLEAAGAFQFLHRIPRFHSTHGLAERRGPHTFNSFTGFHSREIARTAEVLLQAFNSFTGFHLTRARPSRGGRHAFQFLHRIPPPSAFRITSAGSAGLSIPSPDSTAALTPEPCALYCLSIPSPDSTDMGP